MQSKRAVGLCMHCKVNVRMLQRLSGILSFPSYCFTITLTDILNFFYSLRNQNG